MLEAGVRIVLGEKTEKSGLQWGDESAGTKNGSYDNSIQYGYNSK